MYSVVNTLNANEVMNAVNEVQPDIVHIQIESWVYLADKLSAIPNISFPFLTALDTGTINQSYLTNFDVQFECS